MVWGLVSYWAVPYSVSSSIDYLKGKVLLQMNNGWQNLALNVLHCLAEKWSCNLTSIWLQQLSSSPLVCSVGKIMDLHSSRAHLYGFKFLKVSKFQGLFELVFLFNLIFISREHPLILTLLSSRHLVLGKTKVHSPLRGLLRLSGIMIWLAGS